MTTDITTYKERGMAMKSEAFTAEIKNICGLFRKFVPAVKQQHDITIKGANFAREIGIHLMTICGRETMPKSFWTINCAKNLPFDLDTANMFMAVARRYEQKIKTIAEAAPLSQALLFAGGLLESPKRDQPQKALGINPIERFLADFTKIRGVWTSAVNDRPMESWEGQALEQFLSDTEWLEQYRKKALRLVETKKDGK